jgi:sulfite oxidase
MLGKHARFQLWTDAPLNGEPPLELLADHAITPTELFYVRCHGPVPDLDRSHRLVVDGLVERRLELTVDELRATFPRTERVATLHCAGNRRSELAEIAPIPGETPWREAAIGNARWAGVRLRDVLAAAGVRDGGAHVELIGADETTEFRGAFGGSVPLGVDVLLAFEMNGAPLEPVHGFPLRAIVPGYIGARSVKWLERITLIAAPSENAFHARSYKLFAPDVRAEDADWDATEPLGETPLNSAICKVTSDGVAGWACAGGDRTVERVEVDDGSGWRSTRLVGDAVPGAWRLWQAELALPPGDHVLAVRAWDSAGRTQPESPAALWNFKGYANNAWHRVRVRVE